MTEALEFEYPCCHSVRTCMPPTYSHRVVSLRTGKFLRVIEPVRCSRLGYIPKYKFYPADDVALVSLYWSNRGNLKLIVLWKPENVSDNQVKEAVIKALGIEEEVIKIW